MRWKPKPVIPCGTRRVKVRFAWYPKFISGYWVWLERYSEIQEHGCKGVHTRPDGSACQHIGWEKVSVELGVPRMRGTIMEAIVDNEEVTPL